MKRLFFILLLCLFFQLHKNDLQYFKKEKFGSNKGIQSQVFPLKIRIMFRLVLFQVCPIWSRNTDYSTFQNLFLCFDYEWILSFMPQSTVPMLSIAVGGVPLPLQPYKMLPIMHIRKGAFWLLRQEIRILLPSIIR